MAKCKGHKDKNKKLQISIKSYYFVIELTMRPDHPHKIFNDKSHSYCCLMEALAADALLFNLKAAFIF